MFCQETYGFFEILFHRPFVINNNNKVINIPDKVDECCFLGLAKERLMAFSVVDGLGVPIDGKGVLSTIE